MTRLTRSDIPAGLQEQRALGAAWSGWIDRLPGLANALIEEWELVVAGQGLHGFGSWVLPARTNDGSAVVLKVAFPDDESEQEGLSLQRWGGHGAVPLLRADPHRRALLLARLGSHTLDAEWDIAACELVGERYAALHRQAGPPFRPLSGLALNWSRQLLALPREAPLPRRLVQQAASLARELAADDATDGRLIHTDLHYDNVLSRGEDWPADASDWVVIDPKPLSGDPHFEPAPMLWNRWEELANDVRAGVRRRFHTIVDAAGLDEARARDWVVIRAMVNALWSLQEMAEDQQAGPRSDHLTRWVTLAKAVQD